MPCLATSLKEGLPLPTVEDEAQAGFFLPIFSRALDGQVVATANLSAACRKNIRTMVLLSCGQYQRVLDARTTVLITKRVESEKYESARRSGIPIVTTQWIKDVFRNSKYISPLKYTVPCFAGLTICATGFDQKRKEKLKIEIQRLAAQWSPALTRNCSHLVVDLDCDEFSHPLPSKKLQYALQWNVKIVSQFWIDQCVSTGYFTEQDPKTLHLTASKNTSTHDSEDSRSKEGSEATKTENLKESTFSRLNAGATPMLRASIIDKGLSDSMTDSTLNSTIVNASNIAGTPFRKVSVRQSHLDLRSTLSSRRLSSMASSLHEEDDDGLEGDKPDDVDEDSEDEEVIQPPPSPQSENLPLNSENSHDNHDEEHSISINIGSERGQKGGKDEKYGKEEENRNSGLYEDLDRHTQEALVTDALDVYFDGPIMDEEQAEEAQRNERNLLDTSRPYNLFEGIVISIIGFQASSAPLESRNGVDEKTLKAEKEVKEALEEFFQRGGRISSVDKSPRVLVFNPTILKPSDIESIRNKEVLSTDWLTDSVLLEILQSIDNYRLPYSSQHNTYQSLTPKFWTSSCLVPSSSSASNAKQNSQPPSSASHFERTAIIVPGKDATKSDTQTVNSNIIVSRDTKPENIAQLKSRNFLPPTSISASHLLLKSAHHVNALRKKQALQLEAEKEAIIRSKQKSSNSKSKISSSKEKMSNQNQDKQADKDTHKTSHHRTLHQRHHSERREEAEILESRNTPEEEDSIVCSPLTVTAKMFSTLPKKRKANDPTLELQGVKKWKLEEESQAERMKGLETEEKTKITSTDINSMDEDSEETSQNRLEFSQPFNPFYESPSGTINARSQGLLSTPSRDESQDDDQDSHRETNFLTQTMRHQIPSSGPSSSQSPSKRLLTSEDAINNAMQEEGNEQNEENVFSENTGVTTNRITHERKDHGNDKFNGQERVRESDDEDEKEEAKLEEVSILAVTPARGSKEGGESVIVTLDKVDEFMQVVFGTVVAVTLRHPTMPKLWATSPPSAVPLHVPLSIIDKHGRAINKTDGVVQSLYKYD